MSPLASVHLFMAEQEMRLRHALARHDSPSARAYTECVRPPTVIEHGTAYGYCTHKCRCAVCCQWQSERMKESRAREQQQIQATMADPAFYRESGKKVTEYKARLEAIEKELAETYRRWDELETIVGK